MDVTRWILSVLVLALLVVGGLAVAGFLHRQEAERVEAGDRRHDRELFLAGKVPAIEQYLDRLEQGVASGLISNTVRHDVNSAALRAMFAGDPAIRGALVADLPRDAAGNLSERRLAVIDTGLRSYSLAEDPRIKGYGVVQEPRGPSVVIAVQRELTVDTTSFRLEVAVAFPVVRPEVWAEEPGR